MKRDNREGDLEKEVGRTEVVDDRKEDRWWWRMKAET